MEHGQPDRPLAPRRGHDGTSRSTATSSTTSSPTPGSRATTARPGGGSRAASPRTRSCAWCARTRAARACSTRARRPASTSRSTAARAGSRCSSTCPVGVPITDLVVKDDDVVVSTQGRCSGSSTTSARPAAGPEVAAARRAPLQAGRDRALPGRRRPAQPGLGQNPPSGAIIYYYLKARAQGGGGGHARVPGRGRARRSGSSRASRTEEGAPEPPGDGEGSVRRRRRASCRRRRALNRFVWDLRYPDAKRFKGMILWSAETRGPVVVPGTYQVRLSAAGKTLTQPLEVRPDPRLATTDGRLSRSSSTCSGRSATS